MARIMLKTIGIVVIVEGATAKVTARVVVVSVVAEMIVTIVVVAMFNVVADKVQLARQDPLALRGPQVQPGLQGRLVQLG